MFNIFMEKDMNHGPELLLILPTYGHFDYAFKCAESFVNTTKHISTQIFIVDDNSPEWWKVDWQNWPGYIHIAHYTNHDGLTRSWNSGLRFAKSIQAKYTVCGNSDLIFTPGWYEPLKRAIDEGCDLVGPVSNAPGHCHWQNAADFCADVISDDVDTLNRNALILRRRPFEVVYHYRINGFFMMAATHTWWRGAYDDLHVFNPSCKLTGNEDELQKRWLAKDMQIGYVPQSYIFHYRSVSRPEALSKPESKGAFRPIGGLHP